MRWPSELGSLLVSRPSSSPHLVWCAFAMSIPVFLEAETDPTVVLVALVVSVLIGSLQSTRRVTVKLLQLSYADRLWNRMFREGRLSRHFWESVSALRQTPLPWKGVSRLKHGRLADRVWRGMSALRVSRQTTSSGGTDVLHRVGRGGGRVASIHKRVANRLHHHLRYPRLQNSRRYTKEYLNRTVTLYRKMPLRAMSRLWGRVNQMDLPTFLRRPLLSLYVWMFSCNLEEAEVQDLKQYRNLGEFFRRVLKPHVRPVDDHHILTSPADGRVLHFGRVEGGVLEQVKGVTYSLRGFLGNGGWVSLGGRNIDSMGDEEYQRSVQVSPDHELYHCVVYLAPGDYHRFHSPTQWNIAFRRHFPGELLSVSPGIARWVQGLFNFNERVVYVGSWKHGFFSMTAVGATNVGSIKIYCDKDLETNVRSLKPSSPHRDKLFPTEVPIMKGEMFGEFNLGSTIVLIFEAPKNFKFKVEDGQKIRFGEPIGTC